MRNTITNATHTPTAAIKKTNNPTLFSKLSCNVPNKYVITERKLSMLTTIGIIIRNAFHESNLPSFFLSLMNRQASNRNTVTMIHATISQIPYVLLASEVLFLNRVIIIISVNIINKTLINQYLIFSTTLIFVNVHPT